VIGGGVAVVGMDFYDDDNLEVDLLHILHLDHHRHEIHQEVVDYDYDYDFFHEDIEIDHILLHHVLHYDVCTKYTTKLLGL
jgi:hypothetical protein